MFIKAFYLLFSLSLGKHSAVVTKLLATTYTMTIAAECKLCYLCSQEKGGIDTCGDFSNAHTIDCKEDACAKITFTT